MNASSVFRSTALLSSLSKRHFSTKLWQGAFGTVIPVVAVESPPLVPFKNAPKRHFSTRLRGGDIGSVSPVDAVVFLQQEKHRRPLPQVSHNNDNAFIPKKRKSLAVQEENKDDGKKIVSLGSTSASQAYLTSLDHKETDTLFIPMPVNDSLFKMPPVVTSNKKVLEEILPTCKKMASALKDQHYMFNPESKYWHEFKRSYKEYAKGTKIIYALRKNGVLVKIGKTSNQVARKQKYIEEHIKKHGPDVNVEFVLVPIVNLDLLEADMDALLDKQCREICQMIINNNSCHPFLRNQFRSILYEGGEKLGMLGTLIGLQVEAGVQAHLRLDIPAEFLMLYEKRLEERQEEVNAIVALILPFIQGVVGKGIVPVDFMSGWMHGYFSKGNRLCTKQMLMESINGGEVNMRDTDTLPYPVFLDPKTAKESFSTDYSPQQCNEGIDRLKSKILGPPPVQEPRVSVVDRNKTIYKHMTTREINSARKQFERAGYVVIIDLWKEELLVMVHLKTLHVILLHGPFCLGGDARDEIPMPKKVQRSLIHQIVKDLVAVFQGKTGLGNSLEAVYRMEHTVHGLHYRSMYAFAAYLAALAPEGVKPLEQNNLKKKNSVFHAKNLRGKDNRIKRGEDREVTYTKDDLIIRQCLNILSYIDDANDPEEVTTSVDKVNELLQSKSPSAKNVSDRWVAIKRGFMPGSELCKAIEACRASTRNNAGNSGATGRTNSDLSEYYDEFDEIMDLDLNSAFYIRCNDDSPDIPAPALPKSSIDEDEPPVFAKYTYEGIRNRLKLNGGSTTILYVRDENDNLQYLGKNDDFVLANIIQCEREAKKSLETIRDEQIQQAKDLALGKQFWVVKDKKVDPDDHPKSRFKDEPVLFAVLYNTLNDILKKEREANKHYLTTKKINNKHQGAYFKIKLVTKKK